MNRLRRSIFAVCSVFTLTLCVGVSADAKLDISNWKEILPDPVYTSLVEESIKNLTSFTASASQFNQNGRRIQSEATNLIVYAEIAHRAGNEKAGALRQAAQDMLKAAKAKNGEQAKKLVGVLAGYKSMSAGKVEDLNLQTATELKIFMKGTVKDIDANLTKYKRLQQPQFAAKGKAEEITSAMYKLAALSVATTAHAPTTDLPKGKTTKDWLDAAEDMRKHALAAAQASQSKKLPELTKAVNNLMASCSKCHDDFRMDNN